MQSKSAGFVDYLECFRDQYAYRLGSSTREQILRCYLHLHCLERVLSIARYFGSAYIRPADLLLLCCRFVRIAHPLHCLCPIMEGDDSLASAIGCHDERHISWAGGKYTFYTITTLFEKLASLAEPTADRNVASDIKLVYQERDASEICYSSGNISS